MTLLRRMLPLADMGTAKHKNEPDVPKMLHALKNAGKSDEWIAARLDVSWKTLYRWKRPKKDDGVKKPWADHLAALKRLYRSVIAK